METELLIIGGERRPAAEGRSFPVLAPGTGEPLAEVAEASAADARRAVEVAVRAFVEDPRVAQEEIFGPVASVIPFSTEEEAIRLANDVEYGLSGSIWTSSLGRAIRVAKGIRTGVLSVNSSHSVHTEAPFGGYKRSGIGREMGMHAVNLYTEVKNVFFSEA